MGTFTPSMDEVGQRDVGNPRPVDGEDFDAAQARIADLAMRDGNVRKVTERFGAEFDRGVVAFQLAVVDLDVLIGRSSSGFQAEGIVAGVDVAVADANGIGRVEIDPVVVAVAAVDDAHRIDIDVFTLRNVHTPHGGAGQVDRLNGNMLAADPADKERAVFDPAELLVLELGTLAVDGSFAVERDVFCVHGADEKHARRFVRAFLKGVELAIVGQVGAAQKGCVFLQPQRDVIFQYDGADQKFSGRHAHHAASRCVRYVDRFLNGSRGQRFTIGQRTKLGDVRIGMGHGQNRQR